MSRKYESEVDEILQPFDDVLSRGDLAKIYNVSYQNVPKIVEEKKIPMMGKDGKGKWKHMQIHKNVLKRFLIDEYNK